MIVASILLYLTLVPSINSASIFPLTYNNFDENNNGQCIDELVQTLMLAVEGTKFVFTVNMELDRNIPVVKWDISKPSEWNRFLRIPLYVIKIEGDNLGEVLEILDHKNCLYPKAFFIVVSKYVNVHIFKILAKFYIASVLVVTDDKEIFTYNPYIYENVNEPYLEYVKDSCFDVENVVNRFIKSGKYLCRYHPL